MKYFNLSKKLELDITHIAYCVYYEIDYLLTWNCKHLANAQFRHQISKYTNRINLKMPEICTPEEI